MVNYEKKNLKMVDQIPEEPVLQLPRHQDVVSKALSLPGLPVSLAFDDPAAVDICDAAVELLRVQYQLLPLAGNPW